MRFLIFINFSERQEHYSAPIMFQQCQYVIYNAHNTLA